MSAGNAALARAKAEARGIQIRQYQIIYQLADDLRERRVRRDAAGDAVVRGNRGAREPDRLELLRACRANLSAIWGLSLAKGIRPTSPSPA